MRMDIGTDDTFAASLREPRDITPESTINRRLHAAIREETRLERELSLRRAPWHCAKCNVVLSNLFEAQHLEGVDVPHDAVEGEFHHDPTVADIRKQYCSEMESPETLL